jgi:hypothetical protein
MDVLTRASIRVVGRADRGRWRCRRVVVTAILAGAAAGGCYAPALRDCSVTCDSPSDCARGQVCGGDGLCAAPEIAGHCGRPDGGMASGPPDARPPVDAARPDAPTTVKLRVQIMGKGSVVVEGSGTCSSEDPQHGDCMYDIAPGVPQRVRAIPIKLDELFVEWPSETCRGENPICTFTPAAPTTIVARFHKVAVVTGAAP